MLMKQLEVFFCFFFTPAETTNETWAGKGDSRVIEMLIQFWEAKLQLGHMAIAGGCRHDSARIKSQRRAAEWAAHFPEGFVNSSEGEGQSSRPR